MNMPLKLIGEPYRDHRRIPESLSMFFLMRLSRFQKSRITLRAMESLLLLVSLPQEDTGQLLAERTPICDLLAQRLTELYCLIPSTLDHADIHSLPDIQWRCVCSI